jgi:hypothetical protein
MFRHFFTVNPKRNRAASFRAQFKGRRRLPIMQRAQPQCLQEECCQPLPQVFPLISTKSVCIPKNPANAAHTDQTQQVQNTAQTKHQNPARPEGEGDQLGAYIQGGPPQQAHPAEVSEHDRTVFAKDDGDDDNDSEESEESGGSIDTSTSPNEDTSEKPEERSAPHSKTQMVDSMLEDPPPFARHSAPRPSALPPASARLRRSPRPPAGSPSTLTSARPPLGLPCPSLRTHFLFLMVVTIHFRIYKY